MTDTLSICIVFAMLAVIVVATGIICIVFAMLAVIVVATGIGIGCVCADCLRYFREIWQRR